MFLSRREIFFLLNGLSGLFHWNIIVHVSMKKSLTEDLAEIITRACKQPEIYALSAKFIVISQERGKQNTKKQLFSAAIICV